jgi:hypothetical protein
MRHKPLVLIVLLMGGLMGMGLVAGLQQLYPGEINDLPVAGSTLLGIVAAAGFLAVLFSTSALLSLILPTLGYRPMSRYEALLGGILVCVPLAVLIINVCVGATEKSPLFTLIMLANAVGVSTLYWFLFFCLGHLLAQQRGSTFKTIWIILLILGNIITVPLYWCLFVLRPKDCN